MCTHRHAQRESQVWKTLISVHHAHLYSAGRWQFFGHYSRNVACYLPPTPGYGFSIILKQPPSFCSNTSGALNIPRLPRVHLSPRRDQRGELLLSFRGITSGFPPRADETCWVNSRVVQSRPGIRETTTISFSTRCSPVPLRRRDSRISADPKKLQGETDRELW